MLTLIVAAAAVEPSWDCDTTASFSTLEELWPWYDAVEDDPTFGVEGQLEAWRAGVEGGTCVAVDCGWSEEQVIAEGYTAHECTVYSCTTAGGYAIAYSYNWLGSYEFVNEEWSTTDWQVAGADGIRVEWSEVRWSQWTSGWGGDWEGTTDIAASWTGQPLSALPADAGFEQHGTFEAYTDSYSDIEWITNTWTAGTCTISTSTEDQALVSDTIEVTVGPQTGRVENDYYACTPYWRGWLDDVLVGVVDGTTWALDPSDADHDGVPAVDDCDDADPTRSPCAEDIPSDGIDQDCDGVDASAFLGPPIPASGAAADPTGCSGALFLPLAALLRRRSR